MTRKSKLMSKAMFIGVGLLALAALQGCHTRKAEMMHDKIARQEHHSVHDKLREVFFGQTETVIWGHHLSVASCRHAERQTLSDNGPLDSHHVIKCGATKVEIINEELRVNEKSYGKLAARVDVQVGDGEVFINGSKVQPAAQIAQK
ncbi:MAG: hypothetical protein HYR56_32730 [Acidobacteria bacterium]|nr:hypothetical protein [Acidobacteriota bacterium]MBI3426135.1 hypothetical protein [Acidobacteriota bacterium]